VVKVFLLKNIAKDLVGFSSLVEKGFPGYFLCYCALAKEACLKVYYGGPIFSLSAPILDEQLYVLKYPETCLALTQTHFPALLEETIFT
jgi:hypothetical protein